MVSMIPRDAGVLVGYTSDCCYILDIFLGTQYIIYIYIVYIIYRNPARKHVGFMFSYQDEILFVGRLSDREAVSASLPK